MPLVLSQDPSGQLPPGQSVSRLRRSAAPANYPEPEPGFLLSRYHTSKRCREILQDQYLFVIYLYNKNQPEVKTVYHSCD